MARILIVDDDESVARVLTHFLREAGHAPSVASNGHQALLAVRAKPDLVLLDLGLPDISGDEVLRRLKRDPSAAGIPVVIVSGHPDAADIVGRSGATGPAAILPKPVLGSELCAVVDIVLDARKSRADAADRATPAGRGPLYRQQRELLYRLISAGSNPLVRQVCRRLGTDRARGNLSRAVETASWTEILRRATQEGLLEEAECDTLLQGVPFQPVEQTA